MERSRPVVAVFVARELDFGADWDGLDGLQLNDKQSSKAIEAKRGPGKLGLLEK